MSDVFGRKKTLLTHKVKAPPKPHSLHYSETVISVHLQKVWSYNDNKHLIQGCPFREDRGL